MGLQTDIQASRTEAMKNKDTVRLNTLRGLLAEFTNENVAQKRKPDEVLSDEDVLAVISREAKKRKDSIEQFEKGGRKELADQEKVELAILETYLPEIMGEEEVKKVVDAKISELGISDKSNMGQLMGAVMQKLKGRADGNTVKKIVEDSLS